MWSNCQIWWEKLGVSLLDKLTIIVSKRYQIINQKNYKELFIKGGDILEDCFIISHLNKEEKPKMIGVAGITILDHWQLSALPCIQMSKEMNLI